MRYKSKKLACTVMCLFSLFACDNASKQQVKATIPQCIATQSICELSITNGAVSVKFDVDKVLAEQPFSLLLSYNGAATITKITGFLEGDDMFMGKIPLFFEASSYALTDSRIDSKTDRGHQEQQFLTDAMLGSCSQNIMRWRLWLTVKTSTGIVETTSLTFVSHRY